jgi:hypothetical protein
MSALRAATEVELLVERMIARPLAPLPDAAYLESRLRAVEQAAQLSVLAAWDELGDEAEAARWPFPPNPAPAPFDWALER